MEKRGEGLVISYLEYPSRGSTIKPVRASFYKRGPPIIIFLFSFSFSFLSLPLESCRPNKLGNIEHKERFPILRVSQTLPDADKVCHNKGMYVLYTCPVQSRSYSTKTTEMQETIRASYALVFVLLCNHGQIIARKHLRNLLAWMH